MHIFPGLSPIYFSQRSGIHVCIIILICHRTELLLVHSSQSIRTLCSVWKSAAHPRIKMSNVYANYQTNAPPTVNKSSSAEDAYERKT